MAFTLDEATEIARASWNKNFLPEAGFADHGIGCAKLAAENYARIVQVNDGLLDDEQARELCVRLIEIQIAQSAPELEKSK